MLMLYLAHDQAAVPCLPFRIHLVVRSFAVFGCCFLGFSAVRLHTLVTSLFTSLLTNLVTSLVTSLVASYIYCCCQSLGGSLTSDTQTTGQASVLAIQHRIERVKLLSHDCVTTNGTSFQQV